jgi:hypothetical protein
LWGGQSGRRGIKGRAEELFAPLCGDGFDSKNKKLHPIWVTVSAVLVLALTFPPVSHNIPQLFENKRVGFIPLFFVGGTIDLLG